MKQRIFIIIFLMTIFSSVFAQEEKVRSFSIKANPLIYLIDLISLGEYYDSPELYFGLIEFEFQYVINDYFNISVSPYFMFNKYWYVRYSNGDSYASKYFQFVLTPGLLFRPLGTRLKGWYLGAYIPVGWENIQREGYSRTYGWTDTEPSINDNFTLLGIGLGSGYQWVFKNGFTISLGAGGQKIWAIESKDNTETYSNSTSTKLFDLPFDLTLDFRLGYSF